MVALAVVACVVLAAMRLNISADQNKLFDPRAPFFRDYLNFVKAFPENEAIYVVVQAKAGENPPVSRWTAAADAIAAKLRTLPRYVRSVDAHVPLDRLGAQGILFDDPKLVKRSFADVKRFIPLVKLFAENPSVLMSVLGRSPIERFLTAMRVAPEADRAEAEPLVGVIAKSWKETLEHPETPLAPGQGLPDLAALDAGDPSRLGYYYVPDENDPARHLLLVRVYEREDYSSLTAVSDTVEAISFAVSEAAANYPEFTVGVTGRSALDADEMRTTDRDTRRAEIIASIAVFIGLSIALRSIWLALAGVVTLAVGVGWAFGWATVAVGELNLLSIVFLLALIGIGMDYLVQILMRYRQESSRRNSSVRLWTAVFRHVGAPINTACLGAGGAFLVSILTDFRGAADLGIIAGVGLLLCLIAGYVVLPALLTIRPAKALEDDREQRTFPQRRGGGWIAKPLVWCGLLAAGIPFALRTHFDPNLLSLQAPNHESVRLVRHLQTWSAVVLSKDLDVLREVRKSVADSALVSGTESILTAYDNLDYLKAHEGELPMIRWAVPSDIPPGSISAIAEKARALASRYGKTSAATALEAFAVALHPDSSARLSEWQRAFEAELKDSLAGFHLHHLDLDALPSELRNHYIGADGKFALYIYPKTDLWNHSNLIAFARDIETRIAGVPNAPKPTGIAINIYHSTAAIEKSFYRAAVYALGLIVFLVLIDLRKLSQTLLAISVLAFGLPMLVVWMGLLGVDWNFANFFALPILIGAGHEYGVFLVHRYREAVHDPRRSWTRWDVSDRALLLCAYVTCSSFGFFWALASHRGLRSLGLVMTLGTASIYLASVFVLRPILVWRLRSRESESAD